MDHWLLDEQAHAGPEHLDADYVAGYDHKAGFDPAEDLAVLRTRGLGPDSTVVDLGAGTGSFALAVAPYCRQVIAVDVSPAMTASLRRRVRSLGVRNLEVVEAGFLTYEHGGPAVDIVYTRHALHQLPDFWKAVALQRISAMLRPGGVLRLRDLVYDFEPGAASARIDEWLAGAVGDGTVGWTAEELATHVREEFSTFSWLLEDMLRRTGFEILDREFPRPTYGAYTCRRTAVAASA